MQKLVAEVNNPTGYSVTLESRGFPTVKVKSAYEAAGLQRFPVKDEAHFELLRVQLRKALPFCPSITVKLRDMTPVPPVIKYHMAAAPLSVVADGLATSVITLTVLTDDEPLEGASVELSTDHGSLTATSGTTDALGQFVTDIKADVAGEATVSAVIDGQGHVEATVTFTAVETPSEGEGDAKGEETAAPKKTPAKAAKAKAPTPNTQE